MPPLLPSSAGMTPNNSFKPTPHRGINSVLYATLHAVAAPLWVGLTQALGGRKAFDCFAFQCFLPRLRLAPPFGQVVGALLLRSSLSGALIHRIRCIGRLRRQSWHRQLTGYWYGRFGDVRREVLGCASGLSHFNFGNCAKVSLLPASLAPNKSFKPTPHRGVNSVLYATLHAVATPPWGGLTPALALT